MSRLLEYTPSSRITPLQACAHKFFDELRDPNARLPNNRELPPLFNFTEQGKNIFSSLIHVPNENLLLIKLVNLKKKNAFQLSFLKSGYSAQQIYTVKFHLIELQAVNICFLLSNFLIMNFQI